MLKEGIHVFLAEYAFSCISKHQECFESRGWKCSFSNLQTRFIIFKLKNLVYISWIIKTAIKVCILYFVHCFTAFAYALTWKWLRPEWPLVLVHSFITCPLACTVRLCSEGTDPALSLHEAQCRQAVLWPRGFVHTHTRTKTHKQIQQPRAVLYEGISVNIQWQWRCWWPCEVEALLRAWCSLISTTNIQERSELVILVKAPAATLSLGCHITVATHWGQAYTSAGEVKSGRRAWQVWCKFMWACVFKCAHVGPSVSIRSCSVYQE